MAGRDPIEDLVERVVERVQREQVEAVQPPVCGTGRTILCHLVQAAPTASATVPFPGAGHPGTIDHT